MRALVNGIALQVLAKVSQEIGESDDVVVFPAASAAVAAHGKRPAAILNEESEGRLGQSTVARSQRVTDRCNQLIWKKGGKGKEVDVRKRSECISYKMLTWALALVSCNSKVS